MKIVSPGFIFKKTLGGISEFTLKKNGLRVLLAHDSSSPTATLMVTYHVGSRNEAVGHTGATHMLEHLLFKGSKKFNAKTGRGLSETLESTGGRMNATTWLDRTNYFELIPVEELETAIAVEADRMRNALITETDRKNEMTIVRNEYERGQNNPFEALDTALWATAFSAHPYHHPTIGWKADIENVPITRLQDFYHTFYWPNNATVTVIGDIDFGKTLRLISKYFGIHRPARHTIPDIYTVEPPQEGPRHVIVRRHGQMNLVGLAHKMPAALHADTPAVQVLTRILAGGKTSRLHKALVEKRMATDVVIMATPFRDPGLILCYALLAEGVSHDKVKREIEKVYERAKNQPPSPAELARAKANLRSAQLFHRDGSYAVAEGLNDAIAVGDWTTFVTLPEKIERVRAEEVRAAAQRYLTAETITSGFFIPKKDPEEVVARKIKKPHQPKA